MKSAPLFAILLLFFLSSGASTGHSQDKWWKEKKYKKESTRAKYELCKRTFIDISNGFSFESVGTISQHFSNLVYLDVFGNEKGFYSHSQAEIILLNFFDNFPVETFAYKSSSRYNNYASANGGYEFRKGSTRSNFTATVTLKYKDKKWFVDQIVLN